MRRLLILAGAVACFTASAEAGTLTQDGWRPSQCPKPVPPIALRDNAAQLNSSIAAYNDFVDAVNRYNACVRNEAEIDMSRIHEDALVTQRELSDEVQKLSVPRPGLRQQSSDRLQ